MGFENAWLIPAGFLVMLVMPIDFMLLPSLVPPGSVASLQPDQKALVERAHMVREKEGESACRFR